MPEPEMSGVSVRVIDNAVGRFQTLLEVACCRAIEANRGDVGPVIEAFDVVKLQARVNQLEEALRQMLNLDGYCYHNVVVHVAAVQEIIDAVLHGEEELHN